MAEKTINRILSALGVVLCIIFLPILIINCTLIAKSFMNRDSVPDIGGVFPMIVLTDSMSGVFESGDMILCRTAEPEDIAVGDIICFYDPSGNGTATVTHRVVEVDEVDGGIEWITRGDANNTDDTKPVPADKLVGVYFSRIPGLGRAALFMQTSQGLILCVVLPVLLLVLYDVIRGRIYEKKRREDTDALLAELEELRAEKEKRDEDPTA